MEFLLGFVTLFALAMFCLLCIVAGGIIRIVGGEDETDILKDFLTGLPLFILLAILSWMVGHIIVGLI